MSRLTYWNNKEKGSALPVAINDLGDTVDLETLCAKLATLEDAEENLTNFERWVKTLTPEDFLAEGYHAGEPYRKVNLGGCLTECPVHTCPRKEPSFTGRDAICESQFLEWANATQKEV